MEVFFVKFFEKYPKYRNLEFFIAGESYAGKYVPTMANVILELNKKHTPAINLKGIAVGNGVIAPYYQTAGQVSLAYEAKLINETIFQQIDLISDKCIGLIKEKKWTDASNVCGRIIIELLRAAGDINPMNYKERCKIQNCFVYSNITRYLNQDSVKASLGVPQNVTWQTCNFEISFTDEDQMGSFIPEVEKLLDKGLRVLQYYGDLDLVAPYIGGLKWMQNTDWEGKSAFNRAPIKDWRAHGQIAGKSKSYRNFVFITVKDAGHMAPHDQPENSLELFRRFLKNEPF